MTSREDVFSQVVEVCHLKSNQEEADTRVILYCIDASDRGATEIDIHSQDTDLSVMALRRFPKLA